MFDIRKQSVQQLASAFNLTFFESPIGRLQHNIQSYLLLMLYSFGAIYWISFFVTSEPSLLAHDWVKEQTYLNTLRIALTNGQIPWMWAEALFRKAGAEMFLANPEVALTPDVLLLRLLPNNIFVALHVILFYTAGCWSLLKIAIAYKLRFYSFALLWLVFCFNGYLISHLAVGHLQWAGYFLLPLFLYYLNQLIEKKKQTKQIAFFEVSRLSLLIGALYLNGSFHIAIWCLFFLVFVLVWYWPIYLDVLLIGAISSLLGVCRLLPAALWFPGRPVFVGGYPCLSTWLNAFIELVPYKSEPSDPSCLVGGWWEYSVYIGLSIFVLLMLGFGIALISRHIKYHYSVLGAAVIMFTLTFRDFFQPFFDSNIPFSTIERVPSRFIVLPFLVFLILAVRGIDNVLQQSSIFGKLLLVLLALGGAYQLAIHTFAWRVATLDASFIDRAIPAVQLTSLSDRLYPLSVIGSWAISVITLTILLKFMPKNRQPANLSPPT